MLERRQRSYEGVRDLTDLLRMVFHRHPLCMVIHAHVIHIHGAFEHARLSAQVHPLFTRVFSHTDRRTDGETDRRTGGRQGQRQKTEDRRQKTEDRRQKTEKQRNRETARVRFWLRAIFAVREREGEGALVGLRWLPVHFQLGRKLGCNGIRVFQTKKTRDRGNSSVELGEHTRENVGDTKETA